MIRQCAEVDGVERSRNIERKQCSCPLLLDVTGEVVMDSKQCRFGWMTSSLGHLELTEVVERQHVRPWTTIWEPAVPTASTVCLALICVMSVIQLFMWCTSGLNEKWEQVRDVSDCNIDRIPDSWWPDLAGYLIPNTRGVPVGPNSSRN